MHLAYVWYNPSERVTVEKLLKADRPAWRLRCVPESDLVDMESLVRLLKSGCEAIMMHLSKPPCAALRMAELRHLGKLRTRILVLSKTDADPCALGELFCGHVHPDRDVISLAERIEEFLATPAVYLDAGALEGAIVQILNTDSVFQYQFRQKFPVLYREPFAIEDYRAFVQACLTPEVESQTIRTRQRVFISYAERDQRSAMILRQRLAERDIPTFLAARDLEGGDQWESEIADAIRTCAEMIVLLTPNSIGSAWVIAEAGAAWALGKRITPCLDGVRMSDLPNLLARTQARVLDGSYEDERLLDEVANRINGNSRKSAGA